MSKTINSIRYVLLPCRQSTKLQLPIHRAVTNFCHFQIRKLDLKKRSLHLTEGTEDFETKSIVLSMAVRHV